jgi:hypothetical protein
LVGMGTSYDIDLRVPEDLGVATAHWQDGRRDGRQGSRNRLMPAACHGNSVHLHVEDRDRGVQGEALLRLFPRWEGVPMAALLVTVANTLILGAGVAWTDEINASDDVTAALLLGVPALLAAYLARPGEHRLVSRLLLGIRVLVAGSLVLSLVGIGLIVHATGGKDGAASSGGNEAWWVLFLLSLAMTLVVVRSVRCSMRLDSEHQRPGLPDQRRNEPLPEGLHVSSAEAELASGEAIRLTETVDRVRRIRERLELGELRS